MMTTLSVPTDAEPIPERRKKDSARLLWDTKPKRAPNPKDIEFQTAEIVIPNPHRDQQKLSTFIADISKVEIDRTKMNRLIWGDNLLAMQALLASGYEGKIDLIYIDPPFWTGENYYLTVRVDGTEVDQSPSVIERLAYKDYWEGGVDSYLDMMYPRLHLMKRLLSNKGSIFVHIDWHVGHYVKVMLDEIFGKDNFRNDIVWQRTGAHNDPKRFGVIHDYILIYAKKGEPYFNEVFVPLTEEHVKTRFVNIEQGTKRKFFMGPITAPGSGPPRKFKGKLLYPPKGRHWSYSQQKIDELEKQGRVAYSSTGTPYLKEYEDEYTQKGRRVQSIWTDLLPDKTGSERTGFSTQKPVKLLERILTSASKEGDLIADFFLGSGTTLVAAEKLGRHWIGVDFSKTAIQITRNRLVGMDSRPFLIENIGNYQRHMIYLSGGRIFEMQHIVLKLYGALPRMDFPELGTKKADDRVNELVYVGYPDRAVTAKKVEELAHLAETLDGTGYRRLVILGWDYEYNYEELLATIMRPLSRRMKVEIRNHTIPPEVYDYLKTHSSADDIESLTGKVVFHDKPFLKLLKPRIERTKGKATVDVGIERYIVYDLPIEEQKQKDMVQEIVKKNFAALLDYWAVDWEYDGITFKSSWQAFRGFGKEIREVPLRTTHTLLTGKKYTIAVRAVDIFGNDATGTCAADLR
jgi:adenine-specific DNA-methyltransferase